MKNQTMFRISRATTGAATCPIAVPPGAVAAVDVSSLA